MDRDAWADFVDANEAHRLTLTLAQRNLIAQADQRIDWLEIELARSVDEIARMREALKAAGHALRSYQHGNSAPDLAKEIADRIGDLL